MEHYAGIHVSLELSSVCIVEAEGALVKETKVVSDPDALVLFFQGLGFPIVRIGIEAGPLSQWSYAGLTQAGFEVILLETRSTRLTVAGETPRSRAVCWPVKRWRRSASVF